MTKRTKSEAKLLEENESLRGRLEEAEETLRAIRQGEVDALVVSTKDGERIYTLKGAEHPYRVAVEVMNEGMITLSPDGMILYSNARFAEMVKAPLGDVIGASMRGFISPEDEGKLGMPLGQGQVTVRAMLTLRAKDETHIPVLISGRVLELDGSQAFCVVVTDITERVQAEEESKVRLQQILQADKMASLGILVSGVAHEINNPNHSIMANVQGLQGVWESTRPILERFYHDFGDFLLGGLDYSESRDMFPDMFASIVTNSRRIETIVNELRDFARPSPAEQITAVDVNAVVRSAVVLTSSLIKKAAERFSVEYARNLPPVRGSFQRIEQVIVNLVQNACHSLSSPDKGVRVATRYAPSDQIVVIEVEDEGIGIPDENMKRLGDPFFTTKQDTGGTGLGLWISFNIVQAHGGILTFSSKQGIGTRATLALPADKRQETSEEVAITERAE